ncbi:Amino acid transporter transmembrane domain [Trinorchestia longiramus]|nr:Amino acid transporter transmembrane domain [Trinorchestia longiramus]
MEMTIIPDEVTSKPPSKASHSNSGPPSLSSPPPPPTRRRRTYGSISIMSLDLMDEQELPIQKKLMTAAAAQPPPEDTECLTSDFSTFINLFKSYLGTGYLCLPQAFKFAGLWFGSVAFPIIVFVCVHCLHLLLQSSRELSRRYKFGALNYEETAQVAFLSGSPITRKMATAFSFTVRVFLVIMQLGLCCAFYQFVVSNLFQFVECQTGGTEITYLGYNGIVIIPMLAVTFIKDLKTISYISLVSAVTQLISIGVILFFCTADIGSRQLYSLPAIGDVDQIPLFFGITFFSFEGIGLVILLDNKMKHPENLGGTTGILNVGMSLIALVFFALAFYGYLHYGAQTAESITLNLPMSSKLARMVIVCMTVAVLLSFPLQLYVPVQVLMPFIVLESDTERNVTLKEYFIRCILVFSIFSLCAGIPNISIFISFVGAVSSSVLSFIFPPLIHVITFKPPDNCKGKLVIFKTVLIMTFGVLGFITGTYTSLIRISAIIKKPEAWGMLDCGYHSIQTRNSFPFSS